MDSKTSRMNLNRFFHPSFSSGDGKFDIWIQLAIIARRLSRIRNRELQATGINSSQASVLFLVQMLGGEAYPAEIARNEGLEAHTITYTLNEMAKQGLIAKNISPNHKKITISLTPKGNKALKLSQNHDAISRVMSTLSDEEVGHLKAILLKIYLGLS